MKLLFIMELPNDIPLLELQNELHSQQMYTEDLRRVKTENKCEDIIKIGKLKLSTCEDYDIYTAVLNGINGAEIVCSKNTSKIKTIDYMWEKIDQ